MKTKWLIVFFALAVTMISCVPNKSIVYLQKKSNPINTENNVIKFIGNQKDEIIRPSDELYIKITSADEDKTNLSESNNQVYNPSLISYIVNDDGYIKLPYIGETQISGYTLEQASDSIEFKLAQFLYYPSVFIKFINNKITVLGEVNRPGVYVFDYKNINILQAIGYAGDVSEYGNRKNVVIIREQGTERHVFEVDLTSINLLSSEMYLLKSNDIIYVEPLKRKKWDMNTVPYNLLLSVISTAIVIMTFVNTN
jgi:polysaccharide biosynthesis/export protein